MTPHRDYIAAATTLVMVLAGCYTLYPRAAPSVREFPRKSRILCAFVLIFALGTCIVPVFKTSPAVLGRTDWSLLNLLTNIKSGQLKSSPVAFDLAATYVAMIAGVCVLLMPRPRNALLGIAFLVALCSAWAVNMADNLLFDRLKTSNGSAHVSVTSAFGAYAIELLIAALFWIVAN